METCNYPAGHLHPCGRLPHQTAARYGLCGKALASPEVRALRDTVEALRNRIEALERRPVYSVVAGTSGGGGTAEVTLTRVPCPAISPSTALEPVPYGCSRGEGHDGPHIARDYLDKELAVWQVDVNAFPPVANGMAEEDSIHVESASETNVKAATKAGIACLSLGLCGYPACACRGATTEPDYCHELHASRYQCSLLRGHDGEHRAHLMHDPADAVLATWSSSVVEPDPNAIGEWQRAPSAAGGWGRMFLHQPLYAARGMGDHVEVYFDAGGGYPYIRVTTRETADTLLARLYPPRGGK
jgi:hypothetical protein